MSRCSGGAAPGHSCDEIRLRRGNAEPFEYGVAVAAAFSQTIPARRIGDCEQDVGRVVVFLCGPDAAYISGRTLPVDGGQALLR